MSRKPYSHETVDDILNSNKWLSTMDITAEQFAEYDRLITGLNEGTVTVDEVNDWLDSQGNLADAIPEQYIEMMLDYERELDDAT